MEKEGVIHQEVTRSIIRAFFDVYNELGYGFLEYLYVAALERELKNRGLKVDRQVSVPVFIRSKYFELSESI